MSALLSAWQFIQGHELLLVSLALILSEAFALIPSVKGNGILDGIVKFLKADKDKLEAPKA